MKQKALNMRHVAAMFLLLFGVFMLTVTPLEYFHICKIPDEVRFIVVVISAGMILVSAWIIWCDTKKSKLPPSRNSERCD